MVSVTGNPIELIRIYAEITVIFRYPIAPFRSFSVFSRSAAWVMLLTQRCRFGAFTFFFFFFFLERVGGGGGGGGRGLFIYSPFISIRLYKTNLLECRPIC